MSENNKIIHAKWIIAGEEQKQILENHALVISGGKIQDIQPLATIKERYKEHTIESFPEHALIPSLINTHTHIGMNYFRGIADDLALMNWLNNHIWPAEKKWVSDEFVYDASLFAIAEMIRSGTTCFNDMYFFLQATARAAQKAQVRAHIGMTVIEFPTSWASTTDEYLSKGIAFYEEYQNDPFITATLAPHAPYTVSDETFVRVAEIAEQYDLKINLHLHETSDEVEQSIAQFKKRPIKRLYDLNFLSPRLIAIHMTQINDEDAALLQKTQPSIAHCPESNMKLASGVCPVKQLQSLGLNVALGTDSVASNNDLNLFGEMRQASLLAKLFSKNPETLPAYEALNMATLHGAKALGIDQVTGSISIGKFADLTAIHLNEIESIPVYNPISQIVFAASRQQVSDVWMNGNRLLRNKKLTTLDEDEIREKALYWGQRISKENT